MTSPCSRSYAAVVLAPLLAGCFSDAMVRRPASLASLASGEESDHTIHVIADSCQTVRLRPEDVLTVYTHDGTELKSAAKDLCSDGAGLAFRGAATSCAGGARIPFEDIDWASVEQVDTGATIAAAVLIPSVLVVSILSLNFEIIELVVRVADAGGDHSTACAEDGPPARLPGRPGELRPLFEARTIRRADVRPSVRADMAPCFIDGRCLVGTARVGATFLDVLDVSGGVRWERGVRDHLMGTAGVGVQGWFAKAQWIATVVGVQLGFGAPGLRIAPSGGVRLRPFAGFALGVLPIGLTYFAGDDPRAKSGVLYTPSIDVGYEF